MGDRASIKVVNDRGDLQRNLSHLSFSTTNQDLLHSEMAADASSFQISVQSLKVPQEFSDYDKIEDSDTIIRLEEWREQAVVHLTNLRGLVKLRKSFERDEQASLIFAVSSFDGDDSWISTGMKELAGSTFVRGHVNMSHV